MTVLREQQEAAQGDYHYRLRVVRRPPLRPLQGRRPRRVLADAPGRRRRRRLPRPGHAWPPSWPTKTGASWTTSNGPPSSSTPSSPSGRGQEPAAAGPRADERAAGAHQRHPRRARSRSRRRGRPDRRHHRGRAAAPGGGAGQAAGGLGRPCSTAARSTTASCPQTDSEMLNQFLRDRRRLHRHPLRVGRRPAVHRHGLLGLHPFVYRQHGVSLPHYSGYQAVMGIPVDCQHPARRPAGLRLPRAPRGHLHRRRPLHHAAGTGRRHHDRQAERAGRSGRHPPLRPQAPHRATRPSTRPEPALGGAAPPQRARAARRVEWRMSTATIIMIVLICLGCALGVAGLAVRGLPGVATHEGGPGSRHLVAGPAAAGHGRGARLAPRLRETRQPNRRSWPKGSSAFRPRPVSSASAESAAAAQSRAGRAG